MAEQNNIAQQLNDLLVTRNFHPELRDAAGSDKNVEPKNAKTFKFNYTSSSGKNYGTMVIVLDVGNDLKAFYGDNLGRGMEDQDKNEWFEFQQQLSQFANAHRWTYTGDDISKLKYTMQGLAAIKEGLFEGYYGTRRISYAGEPTEARLMIRHNRNLGENDARFRYVESIFVETADGERYRLPFTNLAGGRAMLEHVRQGGKPYDVRGNHICEMITELKVLTRFNRASQGRVLEGIKQGVVEGAQSYYKSLRESIKRMASPRGYTAYFESWHPANITEQDQLVEDIKTLFVEQTIDDRIEQALPLLAKIQRGREMKEADIFENWVNSVTESHWSLPETPEQLNRLKELMANELIVGPDGTYAKEQLRDLIGDDDLFNRIEDLAAQDPDANLWDDTDVQDILRALGIQMPDRAAPDMAAQPQPQQGVAEGMVKGEYGRVLDALQLYYPRLSMDELNVPGYHKVVADKANVPVEYAAQVINDFTRDNDPDEDEFDDDEQGVAEGSVTPNITVNKVHDDGHEKEWHIHRGKEMIGYVIKNQPDTAEGLYIAYGHGPGRAFVEEFAGLKPAVNYIASLKEGVSEADNIAAFESLQRMRHLSGMKLKEARIEESSEFMYEKIGQTLAQQQPMLDVKSDQFVHAVYDEMIELGMTPKSANYTLKYDEDFLGDVANSFHHYVRHGTNDMVDENLGGIVGEAGAGAGQGNRGKPSGARAYPVPSPKITAMDLPALPELPMATLPNRAPVTGLDLTQGRPGRLDDTPLPELPMATLPDRTVKGLDLTLPMATLPDRTVKGLDLTQGRPGRLDDYEQQLEECNYTMENDYCPVHGLKECWLEEMNQSILATGSRLIEDLDEDYGPSGPPGGKVRAMGTNIFKRGPKSTGAYDNKAGYFAYPEYRDATRSQADNDRAKRIRDWEKQTGQDDVSPEFHNQFRPIPPRTPTPQTSTAVAKPVPSAKITATDLPDKTDDQGRQYFHDYVIDTDGKQIPRIYVNGVGQTHDDSMDEGLPGMGAAARGASELGGQAVNAVKGMIAKIPPGHPDYPLLQAARNQEQGNMKVWNKRDPKPFPWNPASDTDLVKDFNHDLNVRKGFGQFQRDAMPNDSAPTGYIRAQKSKGAAIDAENSMQGNQDLFKNAYGIDEADMMNPEIPSDFGSPEHLAHLAGLGKALQAGDRSALGKSNAALAAAQVGQGKTPWEPAPTPSFGTPGAAHAGQSGYDYQDEEPKGQAHSGQGGYTYYDYDDADQSSAETARLGQLRNPNVDPALAHMLINPNNPDAFAMQRDEEPDQSDAETARLGRAGASADSEFVHAPGEAGRSINYESREGDAMLARIKSLALIR